MVVKFVSNGGSNEKWALSLLGGIVVALVGLGAPGLVKLGEMQAAVKQLNQEISQTNDTLKKLVHNDMRDLEHRILVLEQQRGSN